MKAYTDTFTLITEGPELDALVLQLQSGSALGRLSYDEAVAVFQQLQDLGFKIVNPTT
jgi:hypothetical protein